MQLKYVAAIGFDIIKVVYRQITSLVLQIDRRLSIGRMVMTKLETIMKDQDVKKPTKIKIAETVIFPAVTYGSESWTVRKKERKKIDAFELGRGEKFYEFCGQRRERIFQFWRK